MGFTCHHFPVLVALVVALALSTACGSGELAPVAPSTGPGSADDPRQFSISGVSVTITPKQVTQKTTDSGFIGEIEMDVVITNNSGSTIRYVNPPGGPIVYPVSASELILRFAVEALPENVNVGIFRRPPIGTIAHGASVTTTVRVLNPVSPQRWQNQWFDSTGLPVARPSSVTLLAPIQVRAIVAVSDSNYDPVSGPGWRGFVEWQQLVESSPVTLDL